MKYLIIVLIFSNSLWSQNTASHKWQDRVLIISGSQADSTLVEQQFKKFIDNQDKLEDRKLVIYKCIDSVCTFYDWKQVPKKLKIKGIKTSFQVLLIGLDGGEKLKSEKVEESEVIFDLIDQMPMRRQEVKNNKQ